jgi:phytoene desaturase
MDRTEFMQNDMQAPDSLATPPTASPKAVVIGSGFGGLAIAIRLQAMGYQVTVLEKRAKVGGRAYQLKDGGYTFDMGPSLITAPTIIDAVFRAAGRRLDDYLDLIPLDPFYRVYFHDGSFIDYSGDAERMKDQMRAFNPADAERYDAFIAAIRPIYDAVITERSGARPFDTLRAMAGFLPRVIRTGAYWPVATFVSRYFKDFRHHFLFSFHALFIGGNPFRAPSVYLSIPYLEKDGGVWFARGGMYSLVEAFERLFGEIGGEIRTSCEVEAILVDEGRVTGVRAVGATLPADIVVSNGDVAHTYKHLIAARHRKVWTDRKVDRIEHTMSCFLLYLGVKRQYPQVLHHTLILAERYRDLLHDIFDLKVLPEDFSMYLHAPTRTDPGMAPPGCESMYVLIPVANLRSGIDWTAITPAFTERVLDFLEDWGLEDLRANIEVLHAFTPEDFASQLNATWGNAFGIEPKLSQTAYFRPHNASEDVRGLYFVGAGTHPGAGVPGVLLSAETTEFCVRRDERLPAGGRGTQV